MLAAILLVLAQADAVERLIEGLGSSEVEAREAARRDLVALGRKSLSKLEEAAKSADLEVRAGAAAAIKEIHRLEREAELCKGVGARLLKEVPGLPRAGTGESQEAWLDLLADLTGYRATRYPRGEHVLRRPDRRRACTTRRDLAALAASYAAGPWRDDTVEALLYAVLEECDVDLPDSVRRLRAEFEKAGKKGTARSTLYGSSLVRRKAPSAIEGLRRDDDESVRALAEEALGSDRDKAVSALTKLLKHKEEAVRLDAVGRLQAHEEGDALVALLDDPSEEVQMRVAEAAHALLLDRAEPALRAKMDSGNARVRRTALRALAALALPDSLPAIEKGLKDGDVTVREAAAQALARCGTAADAPKLLPLLKDAGEAVRSEAVVALGELRAESAADAVLLAIGDPATQEEAIRAAGRLGDRKAVPQLLERLDDIDAPVRREAALALVALECADVLALPGFVEGDRRLLWELNRFAMPEAMKAVRGVKLLKRAYAGTAAEILEEWSRETGVAISGDLWRDDREKRQRVRLPVADATLEAGLFALSFQDSRPAFIVESASAIRHVRLIDAKEHWRAWAGTRKK